MSQIGTCLYARLVFSYFDFLDIDGLINREVGNQNVQRSETERLRHTRAFRESTSRLKGKGQGANVPIWYGD